MYACYIDGGPNEMLLLPLGLVMKGSYEGKTNYMWSKSTDIRTLDIPSTSSCTTTLANRHPNVRSKQAIQQRQRFSRVKKMMLFESFILSVLLLDKTICFVCVIFNLKITERLLIGRPCLSWKDQIEEYLSSFSVENQRRYA